MHASHPLVRIVVLSIALAACKSDPAMTATPPTTPAPTSPPATEPAATGGAADTAAAKYAVCGGQGGDPRQLAPAFLDKMDACKPADVAPADTLASVAGDGSLIPEKGDCQFDHGITCHFHTSMEFVTSGKLKDDERGVGEMHCIVPSASPDRPTVYGAHVRCKAGTKPSAGTRTCSKALLAALDHGHCRDGWKCCDKGTLTKPVGKQAPAELALHPDFRVCRDDAIEVDCGLFREMRGHTANVVGLGEEITGAFNADPAAHGHH